jgi:hypothetical protein
LDAEASSHQKACADAWERGADQWLPARSVIASKAKQSRLGLRILRLSLDCFAVARNDGHPDSFILLTTPCGGYCDFVRETKYFACELKNFACETKTLRQRAYNSLKLLAHEIVGSAASWNIKRLAVVLFRAPFSLRRASCRSVFGAVRPDKNTMTQILIFWKKASR